MGAIGKVLAEDGESDLALSRDMLGHLEDMATAPAECARMLSPERRNHPTNAGDVT